MSRSMNRSFHTPRPRESLIFERTLFWTTLALALLTFVGSQV